MRRKAPMFSVGFYLLDKDRLRFRRQKKMIVETVKRSFCHITG